MFPNTASSTSRFLAAQPWFASLPLSTQTQISGQVVRTTGQKGELMLQANVPVAGWYAVLAGLIKIQTVPVKGRSSTFLGVARGDWFGEGSALKAERRQYEVIALRDTELLCLPLAEFNQLRATSIAFNQVLVKQLNLRLSQAMALIEASRLRTPEQRVALSLSRLFWNRTRKLSLSQDELANLVGVSRQTANRALKSLAQRGLVTLEFGRVDIADDDALTRFIFSAPETPGRPNP
ncbi:Crp/Fnr family transcriptional regulator [Rhodoferax sp. UBA5149]|uniref:Crp/Fnr family transcriptional regulator n=1 Tax=Rhodoferax sp. UBA5149 TaxID=1947379 RepID=UPI0025F8F76C|nr:Crp/Fnr family transcriptional regulator [Rhodoferax sp. UBA5149]